MNVVVLVSPGELVDKITILEIKLIKIRNKEKLKAVKHELKLLKANLTTLMSSVEHKKLLSRLKDLKLKLHGINLKLWNIENVIRSLEASEDFGKKFVDYARRVYITNDMRSEVKNEINRLFGSTITEVKEYSKYK
ncbi:MAG: DUF6165 family protein [Ignavibacteria bacterium]